MKVSGKDAHHLIDFDALKQAIVYLDMAVNKRATLAKGFDITSLKESLEEEEEK